MPRKVETASRSSPRASPRSVRSATQEKKPSKLRGSVTSTPTKPKSAKTPVKTSPYFNKTKGSSSRSRGNTNKAKIKSEKGEHDGDGIELLSNTGLTSSASSSSSNASDSEDAFDPDSDVQDEVIEDAELEESEDEEVDSDFLDEDSDAGRKGKKRKSIGGGGSTKSKKVRGEDADGVSKSKGKGKEGVKKEIGGYGIEGYEDEDEDFSDVELEEGQEVAGRIYPAPTTGKAPPGRISQNTLNFLKNMQIPERNDRDWFKSHEPAFRQAEKEWQTFVGIVQLKFQEADSQVPILPPKSLIHRIYRDVRFSSDKTPYKKSFFMTTSRSGRKSLFAHYHLSISPNNHSILAAGVWQPGKDELASIRHRLTTNPDQFRQVIGAKEFVKMFGEAKPRKDGGRQNVFGHDDALKVAPKGIDKSHKDIDLLKLRSVAVVKNFTDEEVLSEGFQDKIKEVVAVMTPFVHMINDFVSIPTNGTAVAGTSTAAANGDDGDEDEDGAGSEGKDED